MLCGDPSVWLEHVRSINERVLQYIVAVWPDCAKRFDGSDRENKITDQLAWNLRQHPRVRNIFRIEPQYKLLDASAFDGDVVTKGYIDFVVIFDMNQDNYLAYECKRLNVTFGKSGLKTLADKYVDEGLMRYVSAQYAQDMPFGAMIGYVFDSDIPKAFIEVKRQIQKKKSKLHCFEITDLPALSFSLRFSSLHSRKLGVIEVQHLLLKLSA